MSCCGKVRTTDFAERTRMAKKAQYNKKCQSPHDQFFGPLYYNYLEAAETNPPIKRNRRVVLNGYEPQCRLDVDCKGNRFFDPANIKSCADQPKCVRDHMLATQYDMRRRLGYQSINDAKMIGDFNPLKPFNPYFFTPDYFSKFNDDFA